MIFTLPVFHDGELIAFLFVDGPLAGRRRRARRRHHVMFFPKGCRCRS